MLTFRLLPYKCCIEYVTVAVLGSCVDLFDDGHV